MLYAAKDLIAKHPNDLLKRLQQLCADAGVCLVYTPTFPKVPISGAARWHKDYPVIQLSLRGKWNDIFWFTFFHEAGHIMLHEKDLTQLTLVNGLMTEEKKRLMNLQEHGY